MEPDHEKIKELARECEELMKRKGVQSLLPCTIDIFNEEGLKTIIRCLHDLPDYYPK